MVSGIDQFQPLEVFFDLTLGSVNQIYRNPELPIDFRFKHSTNPDLEFTLYDITGFDVEPAIWSARDPLTNTPGGTFQFGYLGNANKKSPIYNFQIESYTPKFAGNAFTITINGTFILSPMISSNQYSGTIQEILQDFCNTHNLQLNINPPLGVSYMQDVGYVDLDSTDVVEMQHCKWINESDWAYLNRLKKWMRDQQGKGGYRIHLSMDSGGNPTLDVTRTQENSANYKYIVQVADSDVIEWAPDICFSGVIWGANDIQQNAIQRVSGIEQKTVMQQQNTEPYQTTFGYPSSPQLNSTPFKQNASQINFFDATQMPSSVTGSSIRSRPGPSCSPNAGINPIINTHLWEWMDSYNATLTIKGDPTVTPIINGNQAICEVTCYYPINYKTTQNTSTPTGQTQHYSSGMYSVEEVEHVIHAGEYQTILSLTRANAPTPQAQGQ